MAWDQSELGRFREDWFPPIKIPTVDHPVFAKRAIPIPPAMLPDIIEMIRSPIFVVRRSNGKYRIVHDLQDLNSVTIRDSGLPPPVETFVDWFSGRASLSYFDITFQTPVGTFRLTALPMGWTNAVPIFQQDVAFLLKDEMNITKNFVDDVPVRGASTRYELPGGSYETIPENPGIRRFIFEQCINDNRILHRFACAGVTV